MSESHLGFVIGGRGQWAQPGLDAGGGGVVVEHTWTLYLPKIHPRRSGGVLVFVEDAAEAVTSKDVESGQPVRVGDRCRIKADSSYL